MTFQAEDKPISFPAGEGSSSAPEAAPGSPVYVRLLLQVLLPEEDIAAAAARCSPTSAALHSTSARSVCIYCQKLLLLFPCTLDCQAFLPNPHHIA